LNIEVGFDMFTPVEQKRLAMTSRKRISAGAISLVLVGVYSWIMMGSNGSAASWAWLILLAAIGMLVVAVRSYRADTSGDRDEG